MQKNVSTTNYKQKPCTQNPTYIKTQKVMVRIL